MAWREHLCDTSSGGGMDRAGGDRRGTVEGALQLLWDRRADWGRVGRPHAEGKQKPSSSFRQRKATESLMEGGGKVEIQKQDYHFSTAPAACGARKKTRRKKRLPHPEQANTIRRKCQRCARIKVSTMCRVPQTRVSAPRRRPGFHWLSWTGGDHGDRQA